MMGAGNNAQHDPASLVVGYGGTTICFRQTQKKPTLPNNDMHATVHNYNALAPAK